MATIYFTSNADSGDGTLRAAMESASDGDRIEPDPSTFGTSGDITISLSSGLPLASVTVAGSANQRIILDRQGSGYFLRVTSSGYTIAFEYCDFTNGYRTSGNESPVYLSAASTTLTFTNCKIYGNTGAYAGFLRGVAGASGAIIGFYNCVAYNNTHTNSSYSADVFTVLSSAGATITISGCTFDAGTDAPFTNLSSHTVVDSLFTAYSESGGVDFDTVGFVDRTNHDYRLGVGSSYLTGGTLTGTDILGNTRDGSIGAYDGSWIVADATVSSDTTVDYLEIGSTGTLTLDGQDRILTVSKGVYFTSGGTAISSTRGYVVIPSGTSASALTLTNVVACYSGAGASNLAATTAGFTWSATDSTKTVVLELYSGSQWTTVTQSSGTSYSTTLTEGASVRLFDGSTFLTATVTGEPTPSGTAEFWTIKRWAVVDTSGGTSTAAWDVNSYIVVSAGGSSPYSVDHWALDPEVE